MSGVERGRSRAWDLDVGSGDGVDRTVGVSDYPTVEWERQFALADLGHTVDDEGNLTIEIIPWTGCFPGKVGEGESSGAGRRRTCDSNRTVSRPVAMFRTRTAEWPTVLITRNPVRATGSSLSWRLSDVVPSQIVTKSPGANVG